MSKSASCWHRFHRNQREKIKTSPIITLNLGSMRSSFTNAYYAHARPHLPTIDDVAHIVVEVSMRVQHVLITPVTWGQSRTSILKNWLVLKTPQATKQTFKITLHNSTYLKKKFAKTLCLKIFLKLFFSNVESFGFDWHPVLIGVEGSEQTGAHVGQVSSVSTTLRKICLSKK